MPNDEAVDRLEAEVTKPAEGAEEKARTELLDSAGEFLAKEKQDRDDLKSGKRTSGITGEFGDLQLADTSAFAPIKLVTDTVERNSLGQVTEATYGNQRLQFEYDKDDRVSTVKYPDGASWRREQDGWQLYDKSGQRTGDRLQGDIEVDKKGNYIFTGNDGTKETERTDGSYRRDYANGGSFERNAAGQVTSERFPDGRQQSYDYSADGKLSRLSYSDGTSWRKDPDGWHLYDAAGKAGTEKLQGDIEVNKQGDYIFRGSDGTTETERADGSYRREYANGGSFERNAAGQVTSERFPDGHEQTYDYSADGTLSRLNHSDGSTWRKDADGWRLYDAAGKGGDKLQGEIEVNKQGDYIFRGSDGVSEIQRPDGSYRREAKDWNFERNSDGHVTSVSRPDGTSHEFNYSTDGRLNQVRYPDGTAWKRDSDGWRLYNKDGKKTDQELSGDIETNGHGDFTFVHKNGTREITHADGRIETKNPTANRSR